MSNENDLYNTQSVVMTNPQPVVKFPLKNPNKIPVRITNRSKTITKPRRLPQNLIPNITVKNPLSGIPKLMLTNVMSLTPKIDEVREFIIRNEIDLALITETWLKESVTDTVVDIPEFTLLRRDRKSENHGGVCAYIKASRYKYKLLSNLNCCDDHECLWIHLRPNRLPRGIPCIITTVIYHPPSADEKLMQDHLFQTLTLIE